MTIVGGYCAHERNARQLAPQVGGVALAVLGVVRGGVDAVEDVPLGVWPGPWPVIQGLGALLLAALSGRVLASCGWSQFSFA